MDLSTFFSGAQRFAGQKLKELQQGYQQADRAVGGWLPGGGTASPITSWQQDQEKRRREEIARTRALPPYVGKPGERAERGTMANALDALRRAGANPIGFALENPNDMALVKNYFTKNPDVANQYDLPANMFLRYYTGVGARGMELSQEQGQEILKAIGKSEDVLNNSKSRDEYLSNLRQFFTPAYANSHIQSIRSGMIPVTTPEALQIGSELNYSLGRFWAKPTPAGGYQVDENFNFNYAPSNKEGSDALAKTGLQPLWVSALSGDPGRVANNLVRRGYGTPFKYRLNIDKFGQVQVQDLPND